MNIKDLKVGQPVWVIGSEGRDIRKRTVIKVGRKWVYLNNSSRFDDSFQIDGEGYSSPGEVYLTEKGAIDKKEKERLWHTVTKLTRSFYPPESLNLDDIRQIVDLLS